MPETAALIGHDWLLLRGLSREAEHWGEFPQHLQASFPAANIHCLDLPGTGQYHSQTSPKQIAEIVKLTRQHALEQGLLDKPLTILGLSLGGMVTWQWLKQYPEDACAGVLVNSSFANLSPFYRRLRWQVYPKFVRLLSQTDLHLQEAAIVNLVSNRESAQRQVIAEQWAAIRQRKPLSVMSAFNQIQAAAAFNSGPKPEQAVLIINSLADRLVDPTCSETISQYYHLPLHSHPSAGHDLALDDGTWLSQTVKQWCQAQA